MSLSLLELASQEQRLLDALENYEEDRQLTEEEQVAIIDKYLEAKEDFINKLDKYAYLIKGLKARSAFRSEEARDLAILAKQDENLAKTLEARLVFVLSLRHETKVHTNHHKIIRVKNGGQAPLITPKEWEKEPASAPEEFHRKRIELDKLAIRAKLEAGDKVPGCEIGERGEHIRIS